MSTSSSSGSTSQLSVLSPADAAQRDFSMQAGDGASAISASCVSLVSDHATQICDIIISTVFLYHILKLYHDHYSSPLTMIVSGNGNGLFHNDGERHHTFVYFEVGEPELSKSECSTFLFTTIERINSFVTSPELTLIQWRSFLLDYQSSKLPTGNRTRP